ncbi:MAG: SulP family inorganic anion transporter [Verrucomicrobia bacterium]|nr:SulP family inorganic anion transporter [Verrucomicrobiota bacterium]
MESDTSAAVSSPAKVNRWKAIFPPSEWVPAYQTGWLQDDLFAGITLAAYAVPVALAYAALAGLPPQVGVYGYLLGGIGYALFGSSRHLAIGPTSAISLMVGVSVAPLAMGDPVRYVQIATLSAFVAAAMCIIAWVFRLSALTNFISETVLLGFKAGAALSIAVTQIPALFGIPGGGHNFIERLIAITNQLGHPQPLILAIGLTSLALLWAGERFLPNRPVALFVVIISIVFISLTNLTTHVTTVGRLPAGLPNFSFPILRIRDVDGIMPLAFAALLLSYIESVSAARTFAAKHGDKLDVRQELLGLGSANLLVAFGQGYPVAGGLSQSAVNEKAGAKTPLSLVFASITLALCLLFFTGFLKNLPKAVLAAIVLMAVKGLINIREIAHLWRVSRVEFTVAIIALVGVLLFGILKGVIVAAVASILLLLHKVAQPHVAFLGRIPGTRRFSDIARHQSNEPIPGVLAFRVEAGLVYFNVDHVLQMVLERVAAEGKSLRFVVCDLSTSPSIDLAGARMLLNLQGEMAKRGIILRVVEARASVRDLLRIEGAEERVGTIDRFATLADVIEDFQKQEAHG